MREIDANIFKLITTNSNSIFCLWGPLPDFNLEFVSPNITKILGFRHDLIESGAISLLSVIHQDDVFELQIELRQATDDTTINSIKHIPYRIKDAQGNVMWIKQTTTVNRDENGYPCSYFGELALANDIVTLQEQLASVSKRMNLAMLTSGVGTWELDVKSGAVSCDASWCTLLGFTRLVPTISLTRLFAMINPDDIFEFKKQLEQYLTGEKDTFEIIARVRHIDGTWRHMLTKGVITEFDIEDSPVTFVASQTDISRQKSSELEAIEALSARNKFFARVSHEIRTPMHGILGILNLMKRELSSEYAVSQLNKVIENSEHLLFLLNDILDLAKLNETQLTIRSELCSVSEIVNNVHRLFKERAESKGLLFRVNNALTPDECVVADKSRLTQVLSNIISNAIKFTSQGSVSIDLAIINENVILTVSDTGVGIKDTSSIFSAYKQEANSQADYAQGTGLGLEIVQRLCKLMKIEIELKSSEMGSVFTFDLGSVKSYPHLLSSNERAGPDESSFKMLKELKVLVVDDSDINREIAEQILLERGATILSANDGYEAVKQVAQNSDVDVILMDKHMPKMNGIQATEQICAMYSNKVMPIVIAVTADAFEVDNASWFKHGLSDLVTKPFDSETLCSTISKAVSKRQKKA